MRARTGPNATTDPAPRTPGSGEPGKNPRRGRIAGGRPGPRGRRSRVAAGAVMDGGGTPSAARPSAFTPGCGRTGNASGAQAG